MGDNYIYPESVELTVVRLACDRSIHATGPFTNNLSRVLLQYGLLLLDLGVCCHRMCIWGVDRSDLERHLGQDNGSASIDWGFNCSLTSSVDTPTVPSPPPWTDTPAVPSPPPLADPPIHVQPVYHDTLQRTYDMTWDADIYPTPETRTLAGYVLPTRNTIGVKSD